MCTLSALFEQHPRLTARYYQRGDFIGMGDSIGMIRVGHVCVSCITWDASNTIHRILKTGQFLNILPTMNAYEAVSDCTIRFVPASCLRDGNRGYKPEIMPDLLLESIKEAQALANALYSVQGKSAAERLTWARQLLDVTGYLDDCNNKYLDGRRRVLGIGGQGGEGGEGRIRLPRGVVDVLARLTGLDRCTVSRTLKTLNQRGRHETT